MPELKEMLHNLHIEQLTPMQEATCRVYRPGKNLILLAPTGSGKTLAYLLPLIQSLHPETSGTQAIILVPSRELALQTESVFRSIGSPYRVMSCYGGRSTQDEHRALKALTPSVIVGTPGRMNDHLRRQHIDTQQATVLVIDEFDKCLELGFQTEMAEVIRQLPHIDTRILLSATKAQEIPSFVGSSVFQELDFLDSTPTAPRLNLQCVHSPEKDKLQTLYRLLCTCGGEKQTLVFVNYRESADRVSGYLLANGFPCDTFHGGMEQTDRERALYKFRSGCSPVLICTDLAARGLDIPDIDNVVHYHLPVNAETFVHRNGRTARWQSLGSAYLILNGEDALPTYLPEWPASFQLPGQTPAPPKPDWTPIYIGKGKKDKVNKIDIMGYLCKQGQLAYKDVGLIEVKDRYAFAAIRRAKVRQLLTLAQGGKIKGNKIRIEVAK